VLIDQAGKLKLPVHFHSAVGIGDYFSLRNGNPLNLETFCATRVQQREIRADPRWLSLHAGHDLADGREKRVHRLLPDGLLRLSIGVKNILKQWISLYPEKIMFASDAFPFNDAVGAEKRSGWRFVPRGRRRPRRWRKLVAEGAFTEEKAIELARLYCTTTPRNCMET